ncbi:MAG TPA: M14 metallopeptidase family protein [Vicinamibacterales bacterium]|nr:M14 metallopeptidase family protein [Vicinamibacterales bacterium]
MRAARGAAVAALALTASLSSSPAPTPGSVIGFEPCADYKLATYEQSADYFRALAKAVPDRIKLVDIGKTTEGRSELMAIISSESNIRDLAKYKDIARQLALARIAPERATVLAHDGKAVVWIDFGLHSSEVAPAQAAPLLAYQAVTSDSPEMRAIRDNVILLLVPNMNPDGTTAVADWYTKNVGTAWESRLPELWHRYVGHDDNRDWFMMTQPETRNAARQLYFEWFPEIVYDHHQAGPFPARMFVPPFDDPMNPNIPPIVMRDVNLLGEAMTRRLDREGKRGAVSRVGFDAWWDGGMRSTPYFHNMVGLLTEVAHPSATPSNDNPATFPKTFDNGVSTSEPSTYYPSPYTGGEWHLRDTCDYIVSTSMAVLEEGASKREQWLADIYAMGREAIENNKSETFIIPANQWDPGTAVKLVNTLRLGGVEVEQATAAFDTGGRSYPAGSFLIRGAQPFEPYVRDLLTPQTYPDLRMSPGGPPKQPYDITGWTLSYQMGVNVDRIEAPFTVTTKTIDIAVPPSMSRVNPPDGSLGSGGGSYFYTLDPRANDSFTAVNRLLKEGAEISRATEATPAGAGDPFPPGAFLISSSAVTAAQLTRVASPLALRVFVTSPDRPHTAALHAPRIGVYHGWGGNIDEGWTRWVLEQFEFPYAQLHDADVRTGSLRAKYDAIVLPDATYLQMRDGLVVDSMPEAYTGGMTDAGVRNIEQFVHDGGTLVALDRAASLPLTAFDLPVRDVTARLRTTDFFVPGTVVRLDVDPSTPVAYGMPAHAAAFLIHSPAFQLESTAGVTPAARYPSKDVLMSGWLLGEPVLAGRAAVVRLPLGRGAVVLLGLGVEHRGQAHGTFKFLFNSLLNSTLD